MLNNTNNTAFTSFDDIVQEVLSELLLDQRHYARMLGFAIRGYNDLYSSTLPSVKTVLLGFENPNIRVIDYPFDYMYYTKIGMINYYGASGTPVIMTLSRNDRLHFLTDAEIAEANCTCDESSDITTNLENLANGLMPFTQYTIFNNVIRNGQVVGELYGAGAGLSALGSYREDTENCRFTFSNQVPIDSLIVLEYKSTGLEKGTDTRIPVIAREALIAFVKWKALDNPRNSISDRQLYKKQWLETKRTLRYRLNTPTISEVLDVLERSGKIVKVA